MGVVGFDVEFFVVCRLCQRSVKTDNADKVGREYIGDSCAEHEPLVSEEY